MTSLAEHFLQSNTITASIDLVSRFRSQCGQNCFVLIFLLPSLLKLYLHFLLHIWAWNSVHFPCFSFQRLFFRMINGVFIAPARTTFLKGHGESFKLHKGTSEKCSFWIKPCLICICIYSFTHAWLLDFSSVCTSWMASYLICSCCSWPSANFLRVLCKHFPSNTQ